PTSTLHIFNRLPQIVETFRDFALDGVVLHSIKSCRAVSGSIADYKDHLQRQGIPALLVESDLVDARYFAEAQMRNRIDAFFESLEHQKMMKGRATA
ncbi:MAG: 2-hydroxyacyl-CoA dehydratase family protein, partial [Dehalococcoidia bacterium]